MVEPCFSGVEARAVDGVFSTRAESLELDLAAEGFSSRPGLLIPGRIANPRERNVNLQVTLLARVSCIQNLSA